eukprot:1719553-Amphidinium_carterae.1
MAMWDSDNHCGRARSLRYIQASAAYLREHIEPPLPATAFGDRVDKHIRLALTGSMQCNPYMYVA